MIINENNDNGSGPWGSGGNQNPWGKKPSSNGTPPDVDELLRQSKDKIKKMMPGGFGGGKGLSLLLLIVIGFWLISGVYRVNPQQQGIVMRFGEFVRTTQPGLHYHLPSPIETVLTPDVTRDNRIEIGYRSFGGAATSRRDVPDESKMITGDENNIDIDFIVFWKIADAGAYLFNIQDPPETVKVAAQSVMRDIIGQTKIQTALTGGRQDIQLKAKIMLQDLLNEYQAGVEIRDVQLLSVDPPAEVIDAFNDVQRARQDRDTLINEAEAFRNDIVPRARGEAAQLISEAEAYESEVVNRAKGDADRFNSIYKSYKLNPDVTESRIYLETMEKVFTNVKKIIMDKSASGSGVVPYLPLDQLKSKGDK
jgi:membrane protease subunit HflK